MLNEPASSYDDSVPVKPGLFLTEPTPEEARYQEIRAAVEQVMAIQTENFQMAENERPSVEDVLLLPQNSSLLVSYAGNLLLESEKAYANLDALFAPRNLIPIFRQHKDPTTGQTNSLIYVIEGRIEPRQGGITLSIILFLLTIFSVLMVGMNIAINNISFDDRPRAEAIADHIATGFPALLSELWRGWPYALSLLLILGAHEMGHYLMARRHKTAASLPYFLPFPFGLFGTFGAAIRLREPMRNRKVLLDIGVAGPLAGIVFAIPIVLIGLATSHVSAINNLPFETGGRIISEGNSVLYALAKLLVFGRMLPDGQTDVYVNQLAWAGWTGMLVTGLNLLPIGQLDGGHVLYALFGRFAKRLYMPLMVGLFLLTILFANELFIFVILIFLMGNYHAVPLDDITPLDPRRRNVAILALILFFLVFVPVPFTEVLVESHPAQPIDGQMIGLPVVFATLWLKRGDLMRWLNH